MLKNIILFYKIVERNIEGYIFLNNKILSKFTGNLNILVKVNNYYKINGEQFI